MFFLQISSNIQRQQESFKQVPSVRPVERQLQQLSVAPKTQQVTIPSRATLDPPVKQLSVPTQAVRASSKSPPAPAAAPAAKGPTTASQPGRQSSPANPFGDDLDTGPNPFGDPNEDDYDDSLNPFS